MNISIKDFYVKKNQKTSGYYHLSNCDYAFPITIINGNNDGKCLLITSGIHGCEYDGIQASIEIANKLEPKQIYGSIIIIHPVNIQAFLQQTQAVVPQDNKNLNREFPGNKNGTITQKIANELVEVFYPLVDFYLDLHGGDTHEMVVPYAYYPGVADDGVIEFSKNAAKLLDVKYIVQSKYTTGAYNYAAMMGVPGLLIERGGNGIWTREEVEKYKIDIFNILKYLDILKSKHNLKFNNPKNISNAIYIDSTFDGCWHPYVYPGDEIIIGEKLGEIRDLFGNCINTYYSKVNAVVLYMTTSLSIRKNEALIALGELT